MCSDFEGAQATQYDMFKIIDKLMHGGAEDFKFLKTLPDDEKMGWIQFKLDPNQSLC